MTRLLKPDPAPGRDGLYLVVGPGLTPDPDHPGLFLVTGPGLTPDPDYPGLFLIDPSTKDVELFPTHGHTEVSAVLQRIPAGEVRVVSLAMDAAHGQSLVTVTLRIRTDLRLDVVRGRTRVNIKSVHDLRLDPVRGRTTVSVAMPRPHVVHGLGLAIVHGFTEVRILRIPDLSRNAPILLAVTLGARLEALEPLVST